METVTNSQKSRLHVRRLAIKATKRLKRQKKANRCKCLTSRSRPFAMRKVTKRRRTAAPPPKMVDAKRGRLWSTGTFAFRSRILLDFQTGPPNFSCDSFGEN